MKIVSDIEGLKVSHGVIRDNTDEILDLIRYSKSGYGIVKKHFPRVIAFVLGYLVLSGHLSTETQQLLKNLFGMA